jgi:hypothetical protein
MSRLARPAWSLILLATLNGPLTAQGYAVRLDLEAQSYAFRGLTADSLRADSVVTPPNGGPQTPGGEAAICPGTSVGYCDFFRAGPRIQAAPVTVQAEGNLWGFGVPGLRLHTALRAATELGDGDAVAAVTPAVQLLEAYAEYSRNWLRGTLGRQIVTGRLGYVGFDGAKVAARSSAKGIELLGYIGRGLAQATFLSPSNPAVNPLDQFQPAKGETVAGASLGWTNRYADARVDYQREVDNDTRNFVSERLALSADGRLGAGWGLTGGADYDMSFEQWGSADLSLRYTGARVTGSAGVRQYRPFFNLWTIWGVFNPTPYRAANGALAVDVTSRLQLRSTLEYFWYGDTHTSTPLVSVLDHGWRGTLAAGYRLGTAWTTDATVEFDRGVGAAATDLQGQVRWSPRGKLSLSGHLGTVSRPLEFRYNDATLVWLGAQGEYQASERLRVTLLADWLHDNQKEPDVGGFGWSQLRISLRASWFLNSRADLVPLPKGLPRRPPPQ